MISTQGLAKRYGRFTALSDVTLDVREGEVLGILGPNGAGKTTFIGLLYPTPGGATVAGLDPWRQGREGRRLVSFLPGEFRLFGHLTGFAMLEFLPGSRT